MSAQEVAAVAFPQVIERPARAVAVPLTPGERAEKQYPSGGPPMPAGPVHGYVAAQAASVMARHLRARAGGRRSASTGR